MSEISNKPVSIADALAQLGVTSSLITQQEKESLDRDGFAYLYGVLAAAEVEQFRTTLDRLLEAEGDKAGLEVHTEEGTERLSDLVNKSPLFEKVFTNPRVLAGVSHVLGGDMKLSSLNSRFSLPGFGLQKLHADWGSAVKPGAYAVCNSIWLLDDFTEENGATRVVPGSHRCGKVPGEAMADPAAAHPDQKLIIAPAGTVVIFNAHTWHGGTLNRSTSRRRAMHCYFCRRDQKQQTDQRKYLRDETRERLNDAAKVLLDVR